MSNENQSATAGTSEETKSNKAPPMVPSDKFEEVLAGWEKALVTSKTTAVALANSALQHFFQHGDLSKCQALLDAMERSGKNYIRVSAYKLWLRDHAPVTMEQGKLKKDGDFDEALIEKALSVPFFEFAPDPENVAWDYTDVVSGIKSVFKKFERDNYTPKSEGDQKKYNEIKEKVLKAVNA